MFIIDLLLYLFVSFPYTLMRLVLDLFVKDHFRINLDFFILYKFSLLMFHFHLIVKFFLLLKLNVKFRISLAKAFSFEASNCCLKGYEHEFVVDEERKEISCLTKLFRNKYLIKVFDSKVCKVFCFCCSQCCLSKMFDSYLKGKSSYGDGNYNKSSKAGVNFEIDVDNERSTEFNSNFHQYYCPADPEQHELTLHSQSKARLSIENLI